MSKEIDELKYISGPYKVWALEARKKYIELRLNQEMDIRRLYMTLVSEISEELKSEGVSQIRKSQLESLISQLTMQQNKLEGQLTLNFQNYIKENVSAAMDYARNIDIKGIEKATLSKIKVSDIKKIYFEANQRAIEACWSRTKDGLYLSDRIWTKSKRYRETMTNIIQSAVAEGQDAVKTAKMLEKYVKTDKKTLAKDYPNMIKRMGSRVPDDICYESLRLARTETTAAYGGAVVEGAMVSPSTNGIKYILSNTHPFYDVCDHICGSDDYGLGIGVYPIDDAPYYPFHPNCGCITLTINERPEDFVNRLKKWDSNPGSEPGLEKWYQNIYKKSSTYIDDYSNIDYTKTKDTNGNKWLNAEFSSEKLFNKHFKKHSSEFGDINKEEYLQKARELLAAPADKNIEGFKTELGFIFKYNNATNDFAIGREDGYISTIFRPEEGLKYWEEEKKKYGTIEKM